MKSLKRSQGKNADQNHFFHPSDCSLLKENGDRLELLYTWCQSIFRRIAFTKRRATTAKKPVAAGFLKDVSFSFHREIKEVVETYDIPDDLIINID